jgi:hypothetical protein
MVTVAADGTTEVSVAATDAIAIDSASRLP